jgi:signal transduction histidine kinase
VARQRTHTLWFFFVLTVFSILLATCFFIFAAASLRSTRGCIPCPSGTRCCYILAALDQLDRGYRDLHRDRAQASSADHPLNQAAGRVAGGDFTAFLPERGRVREIRTWRHFNKMVRHLGGTETLRSDFVASVSHEFRTPLGAIEGYATLLQGEGLTKAETMEYTAAIIESTRQLSALTGNILRISKLENQGILPEKARFRLDEQIRDAFLALEPGGARRG